MKTENFLKNIPAELKRICKFCLWKKERNTKIPYNPFLGTRAESDNPKTFSDYDTALRAFAGGKWDGLGIRIADGIGAIDIDHCINTNKTADKTASEIMSIFEGVYFERSPSGEGLHAFFKLPPDFYYDKDIYYTKKNGVEVYIPGATNRFITVTGNVYREGKIADNPEAIRILLDSFMRRKHKSNDSTEDLLKPHVSYFSDDEVIERASSSKQGELFKSLYFLGDYEGRYNTHSDADLALVSILCFWCGRSEEQIDRIFRASKMMRPKWDEKRGKGTYGEITIRKAVTTCTEIYRPLEKSNASEDFNDLDEDEPLLSYKFINNSVSDFQPNSNPRYESFQDGNSLLFVDIFNPIIRFVKNRNCWYVFNGKTWQADNQEIILGIFARRFFRMLKNYANTLKNKDERIRFIKRVTKLDERKYRDLMIKDARSDARIHIDIADFDKNIFLLNCCNGTYDLKNKTFSEHSPTDFLTKISNAVYNPDAKCERWLKFMNEVTMGDKDLIKFIQTAVGYAFSGDTRLECLFIFYGEKSRNGKGTTLETILNILGDYGISAKPEILGVKGFNNSSGPSDDIARLNGARLVGISEPDKSMKLNASLVKQMTGNDTITARFLRENSFEFKPVFTIFIDTNYLPRTSDPTLFASDRVIVIPFNRHFKESERDINLKSTFRKPENVSGILNWVIEGFNIYEAAGLKRPLAVINATNDYKQISDKISMFVSQYLTHEEGQELKSRDVYICYRTWCSDNGYKSENEADFKRAMLILGFEYERKRPKGEKNPTNMIINTKWIIQNDCN